MRITKIKNLKQSSGVNCLGLSSKILFILIFLSISFHSCSNEDANSDGNNEDLNNNGDTTTILDNGITVLNNCNPCSLELYTDFLLQELSIDGSNFTVYKNGVFAYWWDSSFNIESEILPFINVIESIKTDLSTLGVGDPGAASHGFYTNIYIHRGDDDAFPSSFANGTGFEGNEASGTVFSYLAYPYSENLTSNLVNIYHEVFHIFQGFGTTYDGQVTNDNELSPASIYSIEALAEWYQMSRVGSTQIRSYENVYTISASPDIPLWEFTPRQNIPNGITEEQTDAINTVFGIRQYSNGAFFHFLTNIKGVDDRQILNSWYLSHPLTPQQYLFNSLGGDLMRSYYAEWAAQNAADFAYLSPDQRTLSIDNYQIFSQFLPAEQARPYILELNDSNVSGVHTPEALYRPKAWGYNVVKIDNSVAANYTLSLSGNTTGSSGSTSHFKSYVVVKNISGVYSYLPVAMSDAVNGSINFQTQNDETEILFVICAVPEVFSGTESFDYSLQIIKN